MTLRPALACLALLLAGCAASGAPAPPPGAGAGWQSDYAACRRAAERQVRRENASLLDREGLTGGAGASLPASPYERQLMVDRRERLIASCMADRGHAMPPSAGR